jgi:hypothetical protein
VYEPGADLATALALASAAANVALPTDLVACGEIGLAGELRQVSHTPRRLAEAARLGFRRALVPFSAEVPDGPLEVVRASTLVEAIGVLKLRRPRDADATKSRSRTPAPEPEPEPEPVLAPTGRPGGSPIGAESRATPRPS